MARKPPAPATVPIYDRTNQRWIDVKNKRGQFPMAVKMDITPELAVDVLRERNAYNRKVQQTRVKNLARAILSGDWELHGNTIQFDINGHLVDGQHRLAAIAMAKRAAPAMVTFGLSIKARDVIDDGAKRTDSDVAAIQGSDLSPKAIQIGHFLCETLRAEGPHGSRRWTRSERLRFYEGHAEALIFAAHAIGHQRRWWNKAPIGVVIARAYYHYTTPGQRRQLTDFGQLMQDIEMADLGTADSNVFKLREFASLNRKENTGEARMELYRKAQSALRAYMHGKVLKRLTPTREELFPLPEERHRHAPVASGFEMDTVDHDE